jgi:hypothetical protein
MVPGQPGQKKFGRPPTQGKKLGVVTHACHPSNSGKPKIGDPQSRPVWAKKKKKKDSISKIAKKG